MVASDGHTYERSAIAAVLQSANPVSPLTREPLEAHVFPNRALKERITEHEEEVLRIAATAYATGIAAAAEEEAPSSSSSHEGAQAERSGRESFLDETPNDRQKSIGCFRSE